MNYLDTFRVVARVIAEVGGTIATNGIQELSHVEQGGVSAFSYVRVCLYSTAYNAVRAMPGFDMSYSEFCKAVDRVTESDLTGDNMRNVNGFDYDNQAWVKNGRYVRCGHPETMNCGCFGREHEGELVSLEVAAQVR